MQNDIKLDKNVYLERFSKSELGVKLGYDACESIFNRGNIRHYRKGSLLFQEGDPNTGMYLLIDGYIKITRFTDSGREVIIHHVAPESFFAEASVFLGRFPATAVAEVDSKVIVIHKNLLFDLMNSHKQLMLIVFHTMADWLDRLVNKIDQLTLNDATARIARYLIDLPREGDLITLPTSKGNLATMLNINPATLSRTFRALQDHQIIDVRARRIKIKNLSTLTDISHSVILFNREDGV